MNLLRTFVAALAVLALASPAGANHHSYNFLYVGGSEIYRCGDYVGGVCVVVQSGDATASVTISDYSGRLVGAEYRFKANVCSGSGYSYRCQVQTQSTGTFCNAVSGVAVPAAPYGSVLQWMEVAMSSFSGPVRCSGTGSYGVATAGTALVVMGH